jgi:hypothetical protein
VSTGGEKHTEYVYAQKKRPTPEGAGLPDVVPFDIVNWEGNYI